MKNTLQGDIIFSPHSKKISIKKRKEAASLKFTTLFFLLILIFLLINFFVPVNQASSYYSLEAFLGFINLLLLSATIYRLGVNIYASLLGGMVFLFGTNVLANGFITTYYHLNIASLLMSILLLQIRPRMFTNLLFGLFTGLSIFIAPLNSIIVLPLWFYFIKFNTRSKKEGRLVTVDINKAVFLSLVGLLAAGVITWFFTLPLFEWKVWPSLLPSNQLTNTLQLLFGANYSWFLYSPVLLLGLVGIHFWYVKNFSLKNVLVAVFLLSLISSMMLDYKNNDFLKTLYLTPALAILSVGVAQATAQFGTKLWFMLLFSCFAVQSLTVNTLTLLNIHQAYFWSFISPLISAQQYSFVLLSIIIFMACSLYFFSVKRLQWNQE